MNIGPLNTRCCIERQSQTKDPTYGSIVITWVPISNPVRWCNLQDALPSKSEQVVEGLKVSSKRARWRLRYCTDITSDMRVIINRPTREVYQIISEPAVLGDKDGIEFMIERVSTDG